MRFEWDRAKAEGNRRKHRVTFDEAASILSAVMSFASSVPDQRAPPSANDMKPKASSVNELRPEYDFSKGVRGKYHKRLLKEGD